MNKFFNFFIMILLFFSNKEKDKNIFLRVIYQCLYSVLILIIPILIISTLTFILLGNQSSHFCKIIMYFTILILGYSFYFIFTNRKYEMNLANNTLSIVLYIFEYIKDKKNTMKKIRKYIIFEIIKFIVLFFIVFWCIKSIILHLNIAYKIEIIGTTLIFIIVGILYIYTEQDKDKFIKKKTFISIFIILSWLTILVYFFKRYLYDEKDLKNFLLLIYSMVFTFPTIYFWLKDIPLIIISPYKEKVKQRKIELIEKYSIQNIKKIKDKYLTETVYEFKEAWEIERVKKNLKEKPIKSFIATLLVLLIVFLFLKKIYDWNILIRYKNNSILNKIFLTIFILLTANKTSKEKWMTIIIRILFLIVLYKITDTILFDCFLNGINKKP